MVDALSLEGLPWISLASAQDREKALFFKSFIGFLPMLLKINGQRALG
jgi:hypothetical protein